MKSDRGTGFIITFFVCFALGSALFGCCGAGDGLWGMGQLCVVNGAMKLSPLLHNYLGKSL